MSDDTLKTRILRGSPGRTILQLIIASVIVGAIFSFLGLSPAEFWRGIFHTVEGLVNALGENVAEIVSRLLTYLIIGAAVVVPIWVISRLLSSRK